MKRNKASVLAAEILEAITKRYVIFDKPIPASVLKLKDEAMALFAEVYDKTDEEIPPRYEQQLLEIQKQLAGELDKGDR